MADAESLEIAGQRLEVRRVGPPPDAAPTILLLHEGLGCASLWRDFPERLAAATGLGVMAYSRAGYGASSPCALPRPLSYMHDEARETLPAVLDAIGFRRGLLLGHSDGASIAAIYGGSRLGPRPDGLILLAPHFFTEDMGIAEIARAKAAYLEGDLRARLARHHGANVDCAFWGWNGAWLDPDFRKWEIRAVLPEITAPMLVIQGADDPYGTLDQVETARAQSGGPVETVVLDDCGHAPHRDQPARTIAAVAAFATGLDLGQASGQDACIEI